MPSPNFWVNATSGYFSNFINGLLSRPDNNSIQDRNCFRCGILGHRESFDSPLYNDCDVVLLEGLFDEDFKYGTSLFILTTCTWYVLSYVVNFLREKQYKLLAFFDMNMSFYLCCFSRNCWSTIRARE